MKRFMFASIGLLCLMLAVAVGYHVGSRVAHAQPMDVMYLMSAPWDNRPPYLLTVFPNGDIYRRGVWSPWQMQDPPEFIGNYWWSGPVATGQSTWGNVKGQYGGEKK